jgi:drug/metabolite transporter (DMT)-like permease
LLSVIPWYIGTLVGVISLVVLNSLERSLGVSWKSFFILLPILILCNQGFWYGFSKAPSFMLCWVLGSLLANILGWVSSIFILKEPYNWYQIIGCTIIFFGFGIMKIK